MKTYQLWMNLLCLVIRETNNIWVIDRGREESIIYLVKCWGWEFMIIKEIGTLHFLWKKSTGTQTKGQSHPVSILKMCTTTCWCTLAALPVIWGFCFDEHLVLPVSVHHESFRLRHKYCISAISSKQTESYSLALLFDVNNELFVCWICKALMVLSSSL